MSLNCFTGIGNLTKDPTIRTYNDENGERAVCSFSIAISEGKDKATFVNCVAFDKKAQLLKDYTWKGFKVGIAGRLQNRTYEKDGVKTTVLEVVVSDIELLSPKKDQVEEPVNKGTFTAEENEKDFKDSTEDLPF